MTVEPDFRCPNCDEPFVRATDGSRTGYDLLGKGEDLSLVRCNGCGREFPVPESGDVSVYVSGTRPTLSLTVEIDT